MFADDLADLSRRFIDCFRRGDAVAAAAFYAPEAELHLSSSRILRGRAEITAHFAADIAEVQAAGIAFPDLETLWHSAETDLACVMQRMKGGSTTYMLCLRRDPAEGWLVLREGSLAQ